MERLVDCARELAQSDQLAITASQDYPLGVRLENDARRLALAQTEFTSALKSSLIIPPAAEWLLDNYYIVIEQLRQVRRDLSPRYYRELPALANGPYVGLPRVYGIAFELIAHTDSRLDSQVLTSFVNAYQQVATLSSGELWAIPIMLRFGLVDNLRRLMDEALNVFYRRQDADKWADRLLLLSKLSATEFLVGLADLTRAARPLDTVFTVRLMQRLRDQDPAVAPAMQWLEQRMTEENASIENFLRLENQRRSMNRVSVGNAVTSMRLLAALDWPRFFESTSVVERILSRDPTGVYPRLDRATRDRYRHQIEEISRHSRRTEQEVAQQTLDLAARALEDAKGRRAHVGYYLLDQGLAELHAAVRYRPPFSQRPVTWIFSHPALFYLGAITLLTALLLSGALSYAISVDATPAQAVLVALLALIPVSVLAVGSINWTITVEATPHTPPKLDLKDGIPPEYRTMVVVPALISDLAGIEFLLQNLERRFLANRDENLHFALLGDWSDAPQEHMQEDQGLLDATVRGIQALNKEYGRTDAFYLFLRRRQWNPGEQTWMGWERKRGKLVEFNRLLRGARNTNYFVQVGELSVLPQVRYVITLDADTELPLSVARRLIGAIAHPLNQPVLDPHNHHVVEGYGIIQPRVDIVAPAAVRSRFARVFTGVTGLDPYSSVVSNIYQDLFHTAAFVGKGIYDVDAALSVLGERFPENTLLSHDLIEGALMRTGLASDIELLEEFPSAYDTFAQRQHRWVRGDWQIADWITGRVRDASGRRSRNPLPTIERWKILDNLRRSLVPPAAVLLLVAGWTVLPGDPLFWAGLALLSVAFPFVRGLLAALGVRPEGEPLQSYTLAILQEAGLALARAFLRVALLLYQAIQDADGIIRGWVRRNLTHRGLLEWTSYSATVKGQAQTISDYVQRMWMVPVLAGMIGTIVIVRNPGVATLAGPLLLLWFISPWIAFYVSQPLETQEKPLPENARRDLRMLARRIWAYFERFAGEEDNWLPPDNFQADPKPVVAHRTSPTNIGFLILSTIAAYDFGYIGRKEFAERIERILSTLAQLERYRGHFYNWYETTTLSPLHPEYVSTVDSGNLAASLLTLKHACLEIAQTDRDTFVVTQGVLDTLAILGASVELANDPRPGEPKPALTELSQEIKRSAASLKAGAARTPKQRLEELGERVRGLAARTSRIESSAEARTEILYWVDALANQVHNAEEELTHPRSLDEQARLHRLARQAESFVEAMDFGFLFNDPRGVFAVGFNAANNRLDDSYYDLLASEARLTSFIAVARGQVPERHWFRLSRPLTRVNGRVALLSWGGSMFEYLMPPLLMHNYEHTLLHETNMAVLQRQIQYGSRHRVPWGISESGFYALDYHFNYQYRLFGVPNLGLRRELTDDLVIAPYATLLALPYAPTAAYENLKALTRAGAAGNLGYYEAIDFTPARVPKGERAGIVRSYMAHHQGMSLVALDNYLNDDPMRRRFEQEPALAATEVLLQERIPLHAPLVQTWKEDKPVLRAGLEIKAPASRQFKTPHTRSPYVHLLSNGEYSIVLSNAGGGFSAYGDLEVTRWRQDRTRDAWGACCYVKELQSGRTWSIAYQPTRVEPDDYNVIFAIDRVEFRRRDRDIETRTEVIIPPERNAEIRRVTLTNHSTSPSLLELTSYGEVVLETHRGDAAHPAFVKLFVESEFLPDRKALLFRRRPRAAEQSTPWAVHFLTGESRGVEVSEYETDRARFLGRGRTSEAPAALHGHLSNTTGAVLDPIMSLRARVRVQRGQSVTLSFITGVAESREQALQLCDQYSDRRDIDRAIDLAWVHSQIQLRHLGITLEEALLYQRLFSQVLYPHPALRAPAEIARRNVKGQAGLWPYGISGDYPIVLLRVREGDELALVHQALRAHEYWRMNNFKADLVIVNEHAASYTDELQGRIQGLINTSLSHPWVDKPGGVFLRRRDVMSGEDYILLQTVARVILDGDLGSLGDQLDRSLRRTSAVTPTARSVTQRQPRATPARSAISPRLPVIFDNGLGGFGRNGREYIITLDDKHWTPTPWINVLANPEFGCLISEAALGHTWSINSQQNKLTPWSNDPVCDPAAEAVYLQEKATGEVWSPTPLPMREPEPYRVRHGAGYSQFEHTSHELGQQLTVFVAKEDPIKIVRLLLRNQAKRARRIRATFYIPWVLGVTREQAQPYVSTERDTETGALFARNSYNAEFEARIAFAAASKPFLGFTADRTEFLGRNGSENEPAALARGAPELSGCTGDVPDPCAAIQVEVALAAEDEKEICFYLGQGADRDQARGLIRKYRDPRQVALALSDVQAEWEKLLGTIQVKTPDAAMDLLLNHWLLYQTLACRVWGRSAFYQSSGAYGFRDQLQDVMALVWAAPELTREHILRAARHQFVEADVQHWWHPPDGQGVRTRISDDYLWLPFVTEYYVRTTGDTGILDELVPFLRMPLLGPQELEIYGQPEVTSEKHSLYEHCLRALDRGLRFGEHGLPLMGTGDWNDGMNRVGVEGRGESVWLGWFLYTNLTQFAEICDRRGDDEHAQKYREQATRLQNSLETTAWDGEWYRRAYFDDGTPLGSAQDPECKIDSIAQSWSVISNAASCERQATALRAVDQHLVREKEGLLLLLAPPFDQMRPDPGYIQGYIPGVRENGGQYTHAALWTVLAHLRQGNGNRGYELYRLLNPIEHTRTREQVERYKVEPYVVAADVYSHPQHTGRGGWTWYTGSAGWMYRIGVEEILGLKRRGDRLTISPCIPAHWPRFEMTYRFGAASYHIVVENPHSLSRGTEQVELDGRRLVEGFILLVDDGLAHEVRIVIHPAE